jgi:hypothetical protein
MSESEEPTSGEKSAADESQMSHRRQRPRQWSHPSIAAPHLPTVEEGFPNESLSFSNSPTKESHAGGPVMMMEDAAENERQAGSTRKRSADEIEPEGRIVGDAITTMSVQQPQEEDQRGAEETAADRDARLRVLAQELCPVIDRFGRVLADIAPHLWELGALDTTLGTAHPQSTSPGSPFNFEANLLSLLRAR